MRPELVGAFAKLVRFDTCVLAAGIVFLPLLMTGFEPILAAQKALPILLMSMSCFVLNDIHDLEKDRVNHPERPIPVGAISEKIAMGTYLTLLSASLLSIHLFIDTDDYYIYLLSIIVLTNYNYVVSDFPYFKNLYVASASVLPVLLIRTNLGSLTVYDPITIAVFLFMFGREILMDVRDSKGDGKTLSNIIGKAMATRLGFVSQMIAVFALAISAGSVPHWILVAVLAFSLLVVMVLWKDPAKRLFLIHAMKIQALVGIVFLV